MEEMSGGRRPAGIGELPPHLDCGLAFALRQIFESIARESHGRKTISLRAKQRVVLVSPLLQGLEISFVGKFGQSHAPIMPHCRGIWPGIADQCWQMLSEVVPTAMLKLRQQIGCP